MPTEAQYKVVDRVVHEIRCWLMDPYEDMGIRLGNSWSEIVLAETSIKQWINILYWVANLAKCWQNGDSLSLKSYAPCCNSDCPLG